MENEIDPNQKELLEKVTRQFPVMPSPLAMPRFIVRPDDKLPPRDENLWATGAMCISQPVTVEKLGITLGEFEGLIRERWPSDQYRVRMGLEMGLVFLRVYQLPEQADERIALLSFQAITLETIGDLLEAESKTKAEKDWEELEALARAIEADEIQEK